MHLSTFVIHTTDIVKLYWVINGNITCMNASCSTSMSLRRRTVRRMIIVIVEYMLNMMPTGK